MIAKSAETACMSDSALVHFWSQSALRGLPDYARDALIDSAVTISVPPRGSLVDPYGPPKVGILLSGQAKVKLTSQDGREAAVRYIGPGQMVGLPAAISQGSPVGADAITTCEVSLFNVAVLRKLAMSDPQVTWEFANMVCQILYEIAEFSAGNLFLPVRQRVSRHLLDLAERTPEGVVVRVDQQGIADSIGSVREVVARALRSLREEGLIQRTQGGLTLLNLAALHAIASGHGHPVRI